MRVVLYITAAVTTSSDLQVPLLMTNVLVGGLFFLKGIIGSVYKDLPVDIVETLIYLNLLVFAASSLYHFNSDSIKQTAIAHSYIYHHNPHPFDWSGSCSRDTICEKQVL